MRSRVAATLDVKASVDDVFAAMVDLPSQEKWILATKLFALDGDVHVPEVGSKIAALTGFGGLGVLDTMTVTVYDAANHRWETEHTGNAFKGIGIFSVEPRPMGATVTWAEEVDLPFGLIGRLGWIAARPIVRWALTASLRRLAKGVLDGTLPVTGYGRRPGKRGELPGDRAT